ncbi:MAG: DUF488 domain-containing protein [Armatimonadetes bacterium]|nr:DUF488 domain-containing protein [Armatimonadota bacterium]
MRAAPPPPSPRSCSQPSRTEIDHVHRQETWKPVDDTGPVDTLFELPPPDRSRKPALLTVGHSNRSLEDFLALLRAHAVEVLVDVRAFRGSRRYPWFSEPSLREALSREGITYLPEPALGGRRKPAPDSRNTVWEDDGFRAYADHMECQTFRDAAARLAELSHTRRTAVMCAEATWWRCHRMLIADYLKAAGHSVLHILDDREAQPHPYSPGARASASMADHYARTVLGLGGRVD